MAIPANQLNTNGRDTYRKCFPCQIISKALTIFELIQNIGCDVNLGKLVHSSLEHFYLNAGVFFTFGGEESRRSCDPFLSMPVLKENQKVCFRRQWMPMETGR